MKLRLIRHNYYCRDAIEDRRLRDDVDDRDTNGSS